MNRQELFEMMKAYSYDMFDAIEHDLEDHKDTTFFDIIANLLYTSYESIVGDDVLRKRVLEMTPDEFADNLTAALTLNGKVFDKFVEFSKE